MISLLCITINIFFHFKKVNSKLDDVPITLSWNVSAYAKAKLSLLNKIKNKISPPKDYNDNIIKILREGNILWIDYECLLLLRNV